MKYHFIVNGYSQDYLKQMEEQAAFEECYLLHSPIEAGETFFVRTEQYTPETVLKSLCGKVNPQDLYIFGSDESSIELAVRLSERCKGSSVTDVKALVDTEVYAEEGVAVKKMVYANHMEGIFLMEQGPYCISLARGMERKKGKDLPAEKESVICTGNAAHIVSRQFVEQKEENGLDHAKVILAAGRGIGKKENIKVLEKLAEKVGGEVAVSRPAAMNAWQPMNRLVGVSGAMVSPDICITAGVSGAAAFYAGIEKSKFIVAVNNDEHAPIMKMADVAVAEDFLPVIEELSRLIETEKE